MRFAGARRDRDAAAAPGPEARGQARRASAAPYLARNRKDGSMIVAYLATLAVFLVLDAVWLKAVMRPIFEADVADLLASKPDLTVAAAFYALYCAGIVWFVARPALASSWSLGPVLLNGAILGFLAYGCYEATNMATLRGWSWRMLTIDIAWGAVLTAVSAAAGVLAARTL
jgi:uncharacterized membrane protein